MLMVNPDFVMKRWGGSYKQRTLENIILMKTWGEEEKVRDRLS